jgi:carbon storage regulator
MALVLTRKYGESVLIGKDIKITGIKDRRGSVRLSIEAPNEQIILREELADRPKFSQ